MVASLQLAFSSCVARLSLIAIIREPAETRFQAAALFHTTSGSGGTDALGINDAAAGFKLSTSELGIRIVAPRSLVVS